MLEASRRSIRSDVDFVLTFEEVMGMFVAKGIDLPQVVAEEGTFDKGTAAGREFAVSGGVAKAVKSLIEEKQSGYHGKSPGCRRSEKLPY